MAITQIGVQPVVAQASQAQVQATYRVAEAQENGAISVDVTCTNDLSLLGNMNVVHWLSDADDADIYKSAGGPFGYIGSTSDARFIDDNIVPDLSRPPPEPPLPVPNLPGS